MKITNQKASTPKRMSVTRLPQIYLGPEIWILMSRTSGGVRGRCEADGSAILARAAGQIGVAHFPVSYAHLGDSWGALDMQGRQLLVTTIDDVSRGVEIAAPGADGIDGVDRPPGGNGAYQRSSSRRKRLGALIETIELESKLRTSGSGDRSEAPICAAIAVCDVVVTERQWADQMGEPDLPERFNAKVFSSLEELVPYLMGLTEPRRAGLTDRLTPVVTP